VGERGRGVFAGAAAEVQRRCAVGCEAKCDVEERRAGVASTLRVATYRGRVDLSGDVISGGDDARR
jgi:hypothetical protein